MSHHFLDTSGLVKHYHPEVGSAEVDRLWADRLLQQHGLTHSLYTLDALQLAMALDLRRRGMLHALVTADRVLLAVAPLEGLPVVDPEHP